MRVKKLYVSANLLLELGNGTFKVTDNTFPQDIEIINMETNNKDNLFVLYVTSEAFPEIKEGEDIPCTNVPVIEKVSTANWQ